MIESIKDLLQKEAQAVLNIPITDAYEKAVNLIIEQIHIKKGKLAVSYTHLTLPTIYSV